jgi:3',5'-cyclic AMP phosphodiesterase CpdA
MRIAHISDLHLLGSAEIPPRRLIGKRFTGWANIRLRRGAVHKQRAAESVARAIREREVDHVVVTGDVTNLALESEFEQVRHFIEHDIGLPPDRVSVVPGNHDAYTRGSHKSRRFQCYLGEYITSDLPGASGVPEIDRFPYVRLRGPVAIIGLSTALPRPPLIASGELGKPQRMALRALLAHESVRDRLPILLQHHPWHRPSKAMDAFTKGLADAEEEREVLDTLPRALLLHGHLHERIHRVIPTTRGRIEAFGATSASLLDEREHHMCGFNVYEVERGGELRWTAFRLDSESGSFVETPIPSA